MPHQRLVFPLSCPPIHKAPSPQQESSHSHPMTWAVVCVCVYTHARASWLRVPHTRCYEGVQQAWDAPFPLQDGTRTRPPTVRGGQCHT